MNTDENIKAHSLSFLTFLRVPTFLSSLVSRLGWHCIAPHCKIILNKYTMMVPNTYFIPCSLIILFNATFSTPYHKYFQITQTNQSAFFFMDCKIQKLLYPGNHSDNQMQQKIITSSSLLAFLHFLYQTCVFLLNYKNRKLCQMDRNTLTNSNTTTAHFIVCVELSKRKESV